MPAETTVEVVEVLAAPPGGWGRGWRGGSADLAAPSLHVPSYSLSCAQFPLLFSFFRTSVERGARATAFENALQILARVLNVAFLRAKDFYFYF